MAYMKLGELSVVLSPKQALKVHPLVPSAIGCSRTTGKSPLGNPTVLASSLAESPPDSLDPPCCFGSSPGSLFCRCSDALSATE